MCEVAAYNQAPSPNPDDSNFNLQVSHDNGIFYDSLMVGDLLVRINSHNLLPTSFLYYYITLVV